MGSQSLFELCGEIEGVLSNIEAKHGFLTEALAGANDACFEHAEITGLSLILSDSRDQVQGLRKNQLEKLYELASNEKAAAAVAPRSGMKLSDLIKLRETAGDLDVFCGDMEVPDVEVREAEDKERYGEKYLYISNG